MTQKFWVVMSDNRGLAHSPVRHFNEDLAFNEAKRLAAIHGGSFFVLEAKGAAAKVEVQVARFDDGDGIPF